MKRFMYLSIGLLCLSLSALIGLHIGHKTACAGHVNHNTSGLVAIQSFSLLDEYGVAWSINDNYEWISTSVQTPPIPVSQIKFWSVGFFVTTDNVAYKWSGDTWVNCGLWPGGTVETKQESWGNLKGKYNKGSEQ
jgi:hypothetical protein